MTSERLQLIHELFKDLALHVKKSKEGDVRSRYAAIETKDKVENLSIRFSESQQDLLQEVQEMEAKLPHKTLKGIGFF